MNRGFRAVIMALAVAAMTLTVAAPHSAVADNADNGNSGLYSTLDSASCPGTVTPGAADRGFVTVHLVGSPLGPDSRLDVNVHLRNADPNATYAVAISCEFFIPGAVIETNSQGVGNGHFSVSPAPPPQSPDGYIIDLRNLAIPAERIISNPVLLN